jgi:hypothetical protein
MKDLNTRIIDLTVGELLDFLREKEPPAQVIDYTGDRYVHGIAGIATLLGVSKTMVFKYRQEGWIEAAIRQHGRKIICDAEMALRLFGEKRRTKKTA